MNYLNERENNPRRTVKDCLNMKETLQKVENLAKDVKVYDFAEYVIPNCQEDNLARVCGSLVQKKACVKSERQVVTDSVRAHAPGGSKENVIEGQVNDKKRERVRRAIYTKYVDIGNVTCLNDHTVIIYGRDAFQWRVTRFNLRDGQEMSKSRLEWEPTGMCELTITGRSNVALTYSDQTQTEVRDLENLKLVRISQNVGGYLPEVMCGTPSGSSFIFEDANANPRVLQFATYTSQGFVMKKRIPTIQRNINDMCCTRFLGEDKNMVFATHGENGVFAYNTNMTNAYTLAWKAEGKLPGMSQEMNAYGVTTDGRGHLFVCDRNNRFIQMFSVDGRYLGPMKIECQGSRSFPKWVSYSRSTSSLVVFFGDQTVKWKFLRVVKLPQGLTEC